MFTTEFNYHYVVARLVLTTQATYKSFAKNKNTSTFSFSFYEAITSIYFECTIRF